MNSGRRGFLKAAGAGTLVGSQALFSGSTQAMTSTTTISGRVVADGDGEIMNDEIEIMGGDDFYGTRTDTDGRFEAEVPQNTTCTLAFYKADHRSDVEPLLNGVPHVYELDTVTVGSDPVALRELEVPKAYAVDLRIVESSGESLVGARPDFHYNDWGMNGGRLAIDTDGYTVIEGASFTGIEAANHITAEFKPPAGGEYAAQSYRRRVEVDEPIEIVATLDGGNVSWSVNEGSERSEAVPASPTSTKDTHTESLRSPTESSTSVSKTPSESRTGTKGETGSGSNATSTPRRGFFKNDASSEDVGLMADPFFLTVSGFVMSVVGMAYQLLRGK